MRLIKQWKDSWNARVHSCIDRGRHERRWSIASSLEIDDQIVQLHRDLVCRSPWVDDELESKNI